MIVGDLRTEFLFDLWNGERLFQFRKMHLTGNRSQNKACANCWARDGALDNLDDRAEEILERLEAQRPSQTPGE